MTGPANNVTPPANEDQGPGGTGPGLVDRDIPPPGCDETPAPDVSDDLTAVLARATGALLIRIERHLLALEARYVLSPTARYRAALATMSKAHA